MRTPLQRVFTGEISCNDVIVFAFLFHSHNQATSSKTHKFIAEDGIVSFKPPTLLLGDYKLRLRYKTPCPIAGIYSSQQCTF